MPKGNYVLIKRLTSKEEKRRIVAVLFLEENIKATDWVGFENHPNILHINKAGLRPFLAKGLTLYLNFTFAD